MTGRGSYGKDRDDDGAFNNGKSDDDFVGRCSGCGSHKKTPSYLIFDGSAAPHPGAWIP